MVSAQIGMIFLCIAIVFYFILRVHDTFQKYMNTYLFESYVFPYYVVRNIIKK